MHTRAHIIEMAREVARQEGIDPNLFISLIQQESNFDPMAVSSKGAIGLTQLMPSTAKELGVDPNNMMQNLTGGARYLKQQLGAFPSVDLALAAYNAGPTRVRELGAIPNIPETQNYVKSVLSRVPDENTVMPLNATGLLAQDQTDGNKPMSRNYNFLDYLMGNARPQPNNMNRRPQMSPLRKAGIAADALILRGYGQGQQLREQGLEQIELAQQQNQRESTIQMFRQRAAAGDKVAAQLLQALETNSIDVASASKYYFNQMFKKPDQGTSLMQNYNFAKTQLGMGEEEAIEFAKSGTGGNVNLSTVAKADQKYNEEYFEFLAKQHSAIRQASREQLALAADLDALKQLYTVAPSGPIRGRLAERFPETNDASAAIMSIRNRLAPNFRATGSGATSDMEFNAYMNSMGNLKNSPEANMLVLDMMIIKAEIARRKLEVLNSFDPNTEGGALEIDRQLNAIEEELWRTNPIKDRVEAFIANAPALGSEDTEQIELNGFTFTFG